MEKEKSVHSMLFLRRRTSGSRRFIWWGRSIADYLDSDTLHTHYGDLIGIFPGELIDGQPQDTSYHHLAHIDVWTSDQTLNKAVNNMLMPMRADWDSQQHGWMHIPLVHGDRKRPRAVV
jgi:hypothetical protein